MKHWGESFSQGVRLLRVVDHDGREQVLSIQIGDTAGWTATRLDPDGATEDVALRRRELRIGRDRGADLVLNDPSLGGQHCRIFERDGQLVLIDRGAAGGTHVNGKRCVEPTVLADGDRIEIGRSLIEVMPGRSQLDIRKVVAQIRHQSTVWSSSDDELRAAFYRELQRQAQLWRERGRPRSRLLPRERLERAIELQSALAVDAEVEAWIAASLRAHRQRQGARWTLAGALPGLVIAALIARPLFAAPPPSDDPEPRPETPAIVEDADAAVVGARCVEVDHEVIEIDTLEDLERYYRVSRRELIDANREALGANLHLVPGTTLKICTVMPLWEREEVDHTVREGETVESIAAHYRTAAVTLRAQLPEGTVLPGELLRLWVPRQPTTRSDYRPAALDLPADASSQGTPQEGTVSNPVKIQGNEAFDVRCPSHAYASSYTYEKLDAAILTLKSAHGYRGQIMVADLSLSEGGQYGRHVSHQSGRDVDIWLPIRGGVYSNTCKEHCGTTWCRPEPEDADWKATWLLIYALLEGDAVEKIFIDQTLMQHLRAGAREAGADEAVIQRNIKPRGARVMHSPAHTHHVHVRFRCAPGEEGCVQRGTRPKSSRRPAR